MRNEFTSCVFYNNDIYYFLDSYGIPVRVNRNENKIELLTSIEGIRCIGGGTFFFSDVYNNCFVGLKESTESVVMVDLNSGISNVYKLCDSSYRYGNIATAFLYENKVICFLKRQGLVYFFDLETKKVSTQVYSTHKDFLTNCGIRFDNHVYLASCNNSIITKYSLLTGESSDIHINKHFVRPVDIRKINDDILILESNGQIIRLSQSGEIKREYCIVNEKGEAFRFCITSDDRKAIILPGLSDSIYILDLFSGNSVEYVDYPNDLYYREAGLKAKFMSSYESDQFVYYANRISNYMLQVNKQTGKIVWSKQIDIPPEIEMANEYANKDILKEKNNLDIFLDIIH